MAFGAAPFAQLDLFTPQASAADYDEPTVYTDGYYTFEVQDFNAYITGVDESISGDVVIPSTLRGLLVSYPVKGIYNYAFSGCANITSITISDSVTSIGDGAFDGCTSLVSITFGENSQLTSIGEVAFSSCTSLESVTFGENSQLTSIGDYAFYECTSLESITIPDSVTSIGDGAFDGCTSLESITISDSVTSIGWCAFANCTSLESITVDSNNKNYSSDEYGVLFNKDKTELIQYPTGNTRTSYTIPDGVTSIGSWAFEDCTSLESVTIPDSVTSIGDGAFDGCTSLVSITFGENSQLTSIGEVAFSSCTSLESITISDSVTSIGWCAFANCTSLTSITVDSNNKNFSSDEYGVLFNKNKTELIQYPIGNTRTSYTIPDNVTSIGEYAFYRCTSLASVTFGENSQLTSIGDYAFCWCTSLESITIPDSVTSIGDDAFSGCTNLSSITIPDSVTSISEGAFDSCTNLSSITIPDSVTSIGYGAFDDCASLKDVYYSGTESEWNAIIINLYNECLTEANIHFNSTGVVKYPSQITIDYGDSIILHVDESKIPDGGYVEWSSDNENFTVTASEDGKTITVTPNENGETNFTATIFDKDGNVVGSDTQTMTSKVNLFVKIIAFFKKLFGLNKVIPESLVELF